MVNYAGKKNIRLLKFFTIKLESMNEKDFKPIVKNILSQLGLNTKDIATNNSTQMPDFEVTGSTDKYTVELKIKDDNPEEIETENQALSRGELVGRSISIGPRNGLAAIIRKGVSQMLEFDPSGQTYRVIWLYSAGQDPEEHNMRFHATLFGTETLFSLRLPNSITCYYFHESAFYSWRNYLDGAILTSLNTARDSINIKLCINTLSPRVDKFRQSELVQSLSNGLCDPDKLHTHNDVFIADCPLDRKDSNKILAYLQNKYNIDHLQTIPMSKHTGKILLEPDKED
jgi:hypothetical protein